jgi:O-antigen ligase
LNLLILSAVLAAIYGIFQFFTGTDLIRNRALGQFGNYYRAVGAYGSFLSYAGNQLMVLACSYAAFLFPSRSKAVKLSYLAAAGIIFLSIIATQSRSSWLALPVIVLLGLLTVNRKQLLYIGGSLVIMVLIVMIFIPELQSRFMSIFNFAQNETRLNLWRSSMAIISDHPVAGIGSGTFNDYLEIYRVPGFYDARGHAHNDYLNKAENCSGNDYGYQRNFGSSPVSMLLYGPGE